MTEPKSSTFRLHNGTTEVEIQKKCSDPYRHLDALNLETLSRYRYQIYANF